MNQSLFKRAFLKFTFYKNRVVGLRVADRVSNQTRYVFGFSPLHSAARCDQWPQPPTGLLLAAAEAGAVVLRLRACGAPAKVGAPVRVRWPEIGRPGGGGGGFVQ